jgi:8-oxo-dGTP pyrophosphatase MutT (NUDIX family)
MAGKVTSCGVLVVDRERELLLGHATGAAHWDIPKGVGEAAETARETAVREALEECGLRLDPAALLDLGRFAYRPGKDLQLYATLMDRIDVSQCTCTSLFRDPRGHMRPEMDAFEWTAFERVPARCARNMARVLTVSVSLDDVLARLTSNGG